MSHYSIKNIIVTIRMLKDTANWFVYLLRCADNSLYTGITTDVERRLKQHNHCNKTGAKYTRVRRPVALAYLEPATNRSAASQREYQLKQLTKAEKERLVKKQAIEK
ncbi:hypothetical protein tinsulaeT_24490 [Thalassotalea insulae]|uniref:GIY-YIG domain-containing protein n=1 Tax=Thalassotalea insulae TaxID=2056778 RepID=A0ABQ6GTX4_9GAMM|nr:GIY-YIG nuclease family protein [Thalassotalea insulae]GLX79109.1 hypothetical protein tinsulaeT_24490 [Thalassotalea insulae]